MNPIPIMYIYHHFIHSYQYSHNHDLEILPGITELTWLAAANVKFISSAYPRFGTATVFVANSLIAVREVRAIAAISEK